MFDHSASSEQNLLVIATDGACVGNPGPGGWAYVFMSNDEKQVTNVVSGGNADTTNQRMELEAAIRALEDTDTERTVRLITDSQYVKNGITDWIYAWKRKGWKASNRKPVKNQDLWKALDELSQSRQVYWEWVKGHSGHIGNETADTAATAEAERQANSISQSADPTA